MPNDGARHLDVASPAAPAGAVQDGDLVSHLGAHDGARQWEAGIVVGGEGRLGQESAGAGRRAGSGELAQVAEALIAKLVMAVFSWLSRSPLGVRRESRSSRASSRSGSWGLQMTMSSAKRA